MVKRTGRPTTFDDKVQKAAWDYIEQFENHGDAFPSVVGLCKALNRSRSTIYDWANRDDNDFAEILDTINEVQQWVILNKAIRNELNPQISKLVLGKHGYHDRQDVNVNDKRDPDDIGSEAANTRIAELLGRGKAQATEKPTTH